MALSLLIDALDQARNALRRLEQKEQGSTVLTLRMLFREGKTLLKLELASSNLPPGQISIAPEPDVDTRLSWELPFHNLVHFSEGKGALQPSNISLVIPDSFVEDLRYRLISLEGASTRQLWIKLCRPYGLIGSIAWEKELGNVLQRPLLRLPDFPSRPTERPDILESALLVDPGDDALVEDVVCRLRVIVQGFLKGSSRALTRLHIFPCNKWYSTLQKLEPDERVILHNPDDAQTSSAAFRASQASETISLRSAAWSSWIIDVMRGRSLDVVQLFCRSQWSDIAADLVLSSSPSPNETAITLMMIDSDELNLLLNRAGAWAIVFIPALLEDQHNMSYVADAFAQRRPGAVLFHPLDTADQHAAYLAACKLLFNSKCSHTPLLGSGFLYCHPDFAQPPQEGRYNEVFSVLAENALLLAQRAPITQRLYTNLTRILPGVDTVDASTPPNYVAAAQRFLESAIFEGVRRSASDVLFSQSSSAQEISKQTETLNESLQQKNSTLGEIQGVIQDYLKTQRKES